MFALDGNVSNFADQATKVLESSGVPVDKEKDDSFTFALYRIDPRDQYEYLTAVAGVRLLEPMWGLRSHDDARHFLGGRIDNPRGFRCRENIPTVRGEFHRTFPIMKSGAVLWVSKRGKPEWTAWEEHKDETLEQLETLLSKEKQSDEPLFPELWYAERELRDRLRSAVASLGHRPDIQEVANELHEEILQRFRRLPINSGHLRCGIYLYTGNDWTLEGGSVNRWFPHVVARTHRPPRYSRLFGFGGFSDDKDAMDKENIFDWVHCSLRSVLITPKSNFDYWLGRLKRSGISPIHHRPWCLIFAPILDFADSSRAIGVLEVAAWDTDPPLSPAHVFLASRTALSISGYIAPLLPIAGFPWWPDAKLGRGRDVVIDRSGLDPPFEAQSIAQDLMPNSSHVGIIARSSGLTDSDVYQLEVHDESRVSEIPRILKIGSAEVLGDELWRYYRYAHNKVPGSHSRVTAAVSYPWKPWPANGMPAAAARGTELPGPAVEYGNSGTAAIVYTLVAPGQHASQWDTWAKKAKRDEIEAGVRLLMQQLDCWHGRRQTEQPLSAALNTKAVLARLAEREGAERGVPGGPLTNPSVKEVREFLHKFYGARVDPVPKTVHTCIAHGDTHCNNLFAIVDETGSIKSVAIIDWGKVRSKCHPLTDISILLSDLVFRVRCSENGELKWAHERYTERAGEFSEEEARAVYVTHLCRMLTWRSRGSGEPWIPVPHRGRAWQVLNQQDKWQLFGVTC